MRYHLLAITVLPWMIIIGCKNERKQEPASVVIIGKGQMPNATKDNSGNVHLVFGSGDSILYSSSMDQGKSFSKPRVVSILPELAASHMRGPQISSTSNGLTIIACNAAGDIFSYKKISSENWQPAGRVNDVDTVAKENFMALNGDGQMIYAVWLDLRDKDNKIFGAKSTDGGESWSKNVMIYASPDTTVCECCKPSVVVKGNNVFVMFRNWINGNRDIHLIRSDDGGLTFNTAQKLGTGSWELKGCPMDGGAITLDTKQQIHSVWNRKGKIFACEPGKPEIEIGEGRGCTITSKNDQNVYAWVEKGEIVCLLPFAGKKRLGKGHSPVISSISDKQIICIWENENKIYFENIDL